MSEARYTIGFIKPPRKSAGWDRQMMIKRTDICTQKKRSVPAAMVQLTKKELSHMTKVSSGFLLPVTPLRVFEKGRGHWQTKYKERGTSIN